MPIAVFAIHFRVAFFELTRRTILKYHKINFGIAKTKKFTKIIAKIAQKEPTVYFSNMAASHSRVLRIPTSGITTVNNGGHGIFSDDVAAGDLDLQLRFYLKLSNFFTER